MDMNYFGSILRIQFNCFQVRRDPLQRCRCSGGEAEGPERLRIHGRTYSG